VLDDFLVVVAEVGVGHAEGLEDVFGCELAEGHAGDAFDDLGEEGEAGVGVHELFAGGEVEGFLSVDDGEDVVVGDEVLGVAPAGVAEQSPLIAEAASVVHHLAEGDGDAEVLELGNVFVDVVVEGELALCLQEQDGEGGELLGHGGDVEDGLGSDGDVVIEVGHAVAVGVDDLAVFVDAEGAAGGVGAVPLGEELVDLGGLGGGEGLRGGETGGGGDKKQGKQGEVGLHGVPSWGRIGGAESDAVHFHRMGLGVQVLASLAGAQRVSGHGDRCESQGKGKEYGGVDLLWTDSTFRTIVRFVL